MLPKLNPLLRELISISGQFPSHKLGAILDIVFNDKFSGEPP